MFVSERNLVPMMQKLLSAVPVLYSSTVSSSWVRKREPGLRLTRYRRKNSWSAP